MKLAAQHTSQQEPKLWPWLLVALLGSFIATLVWFGSATGPEDNLAPVVSLPQTTTAPTPAPTMAPTALVAPSQPTAPIANPPVRAKAPPIPNEERIHPVEDSEEDAKEEPAEENND